MKQPIPRILLLAIPLAASSFLASCVTELDQSARPGTPALNGFTTYMTLPTDYSGDAYYYNNRYYAGGRYEPGTYTYGGQTYDHRYVYNGQYFYGGDYRRQAATTSIRPLATPVSSSVGYMTYQDLPHDYTGDAYYYNNRYYAGGRYEPGTYSYKGRTYTQRYFHDGQYLYGGDYRQPVSSPRYRDNSPRSQR